MKYLKQVLSSNGVGLSPGGTHFNAVVINALFNFKPSLTLIELFLASEEFPSLVPEPPKWRYDKSTTEFFWTSRNYKASY